MLLPLQLQQAIEQAEAAMAFNEKHTLAPFYRQAIYKAISSITDDKANHLCGWLALLTAQYVLPIWEQDWPNSSLAFHLLDVAKAVLHGKTDADTATVEATRGWNQLEDLGDKAEVWSNLSGYYAGTAAAQSLIEVLGGCPFTDVEVNEGTSDGDLDPGTNDAASWAVAAYAGAVWDSKCDFAKQEEFWKWWLQEAIPQAWQLAVTSTDESW